MRRVLALAVWAAALHGQGERLSETVSRAAGLYRQGQQGEAEKAVAAALRVVEERRGTPDFETAGALNGLGALLYSAGDIGRAADLFERSRAAYSRLLHGDDPRLATVLFNLAAVQTGQGRYAEAEALYHRAAAIREKTLGPGDPLMAEVWNGIGVLHLKQKRFSDAARWLEKAISLWEKSAAWEAYAAVALSNLALVRRAEGAAAEAESLYRRALALEEKTFGREHPELATTLMDLGALYRSKGDTEQAGAALKRAAALLEKTVGMQDPLAAEARRQLNELGLQ